MPEIQKSEYPLPPVSGAGAEQWKLDEETHELVKVQGVPREVISHLDHLDFLRTGQGGEPIDKQYKPQAPPAAVTAVMGSTTATVSWQAVPVPAGAAVTYGVRVQVNDVNRTVVGNYNGVHADCQTTALSLAVAGLTGLTAYRFSVWARTVEKGTSIYSLVYVGSTSASTTMSTLIAATSSDYHWPLQDASGTAIAPSKGNAGGVYGGNFELGQTTIDVNGLRSVRFSQAGAGGHGLISIPRVQLPRSFFVGFLTAKTTDQAADRGFVQLFNTGEGNSQLRFRTAITTLAEELGKLGVWWRSNNGGTGTTAGSANNIIGTTSMESPIIFDGSAEVKKLAVGFLVKPNGTSNVDIKLTLMWGADQVLVLERINNVFYSTFVDTIALATNASVSTGVAVASSTISNKCNLQHLVFAMGSNTPTDAQVTSILASFR